MKFYIFLLLASLHEGFAYNNSVENPCQRPTGEPGDCVPITDCHCLNPGPEMTSRFTKKYVRRSECGFTLEKVPKVCCPLKDPNIPDCYKCKKFHYITSSLLPGPKECGFGQFNLGIIGGHPVVKGEFPWMAALQYIVDPYLGMVSYECGGSLINERYVLTAAHCIKENLVNVILGEVDLSGNNTNSTHAIEKKIVFESYNTKSDYHDIALLRLKEKVDYSEYIRPICLPTTADQIFDNYIERIPYVSGWGTTKANSGSEVGGSILLKASVFIKNCARYYDNKDYGQLCAGKMKTDTCFGDSGGPLMLLQPRSDEGSNWYAVGIVSGGLECANPKQPGIYARVSKYMYWIVDNMEP